MYVIFYLCVPSFKYLPKFGPLSLVECYLKAKFLCQVAQVFWRLRKENRKFKACLGY